MPAEYNIEDGAQALDPNLVLEMLGGNAWISGMGFTTNGDMTVSLATGDALVGGTLESPAAATVTIPTADADHPRKDLIYLDGTGSFAVASGTAARARPSGKVREQTYQPEPPSGTSITGTPLWEVWVAAGTTEIVDADLRDRRVSADVIFNALQAKSATLGATTLTGALNADTNNITNVGQADVSRLDFTDANNAVTTANTGTSYTIDLSTANQFKLTLTDNVTFSISATGAEGNSFTLTLQQDSTGGRSITWPSSVEWSFGSAPTLSTAANDKHVITFLSNDGGTTWIGSVGAEEVA